MLIFFLLLENLCEKRGGRKLMQIEVFSHYHNFIGFKVTMTVLHVCALLWFPFIHVCGCQYGGTGRGE